jgi:hypothetical protein
LLTLGSLATIDRGNNISFVVPALFLYLLALHARRWLWVVAAITIISTIKFWGIYFVVGLLAHRKYRHAAWSLTLSATTNLIGIVVMHLRGFDYSLYTKIRNSVEVVLDRDYSDFVSPFAISFSGLSKRVACIFVQDGPCDMPSVSASMVGSSPVKIFLLLTCLFTVILLIRNQNVPAYVWMTAISGLGVVAVPDAPAYNAAVIIAALGAIISTSSPGSSSESGDIGSWQLITAIPIVASLTPAVLVHHEPWATSTVSGDELWWRSYYFTIPLSWFLFYASSILFALHLKRSGDEGPPPPQHTSRSRSQ